MVANCLISGVATEFAMVSGEAPGQLGRDIDGREVGARQRRDRQQAVGEHASPASWRPESRMVSATALKGRMNSAETGSRAGSHPRLSDAVRFGPLPVAVGDAHAVRRRADLRRRPGRRQRRRRSRPLVADGLAPSHDLAERDLAIRTHDVHERSVLARLDRHGGMVTASGLAQLHFDVDILAGPECTVVIGEMLLAVIVPEVVSTLLAVGRRRRGCRARSPSHRHGCRECQAR